MAKEIYLICNAHLDPVWLWKREEGMAEAISTFRVAADFCEKYEGFIFNHNEAVLYEWVEQYEPALFSRIQRLVKEGKWKIMGGWFLQPDCIMPCGESFIRQIEVGNQYFQEKFGVVPKTAINFDPFGHTRGLVQILAKSGYENYFFMRPLGSVPEQNFIWKGYDGSEVLGHSMKGVYNSPKGRIQERLEPMVQAEEERVMMCWGVGNHGGGPSEEDWQTIMRYMKEHPEVTFIPSGCEEYFATVDRDKLRVIERSFVHCMIGCYTSMVRIKQKHRMLENELAICEKMLAVSGVDYDKKEMKRAVKSLLFSEFHDSLPGTMIKRAEEDMLREMDYGREIIAKKSIKAFFKLCEGQPACKRGEIPVLVFNPHPYWVEQEVEVEFQLEEQNWNDNEVTLVRVRAAEGKYLPSQNIKEDCTFSLDWRKRVVFRAALKPMSMNRFDCELYIVNQDKRPITPCEETDTHFVVTNDRMKVAISKKTGWIDTYRVDGSDYLKKGSAVLYAFEDDEDPWKMDTDGFYNQIGQFSILSKEESNAFNGFPLEDLENVRVIENGDVIIKIQATFGYSKSFAVVTYTMSKFDTYVDIKLKLYSNDANRMYKLAFPTTFQNSRFVGQQAFGRETLLKEGKEVNYQKWCGLFEGEKGFSVLNTGSYGGSCVDNTMYISVLRTPVYSAFPIPNRPIAEKDRNHEHMDMGEREFTYRLTADCRQLDVKAEIYNQSMYILSFFPSGVGEKKDTRVELNNLELILSRYEKKDDKKAYVRVFNPTEQEQSGILYSEGKEVKIRLSAFAFDNYVL